MGRATAFEVRTALKHPGRDTSQKAAQEAAQEAVREPVGRKSVIISEE
jgi:hypothetical protein